MESSHLAIVLALTLACTGVMFLIIAKQVRGRSGMATFALGLALFGVVFAVPTQLDEQASLPLGVLLDATAVAAVLLLRRGLQRFMYLPEAPWSRWFGGLLAFAAIAAGLRVWLGDAARPLTLDLTLTVLFGWLAWGTGRDANRDNPLLRLPLSLLTAVLAVLGLLSLGQALQLLTLGQYEHAVRLLDEVGRLIGGWRKAQARAATARTACAPSG